MSFTPIGFILASGACIQPRRVMAPAIAAMLTQAFPFASADAWGKADQSPECLTFVDGLSLVCKVDHADVVSDLAVFLNVLLTQTVGLRRPLRGHTSVDETGPPERLMVWWKFNWFPEQPVRESPACQLIPLRWREPEVLADIFGFRSLDFDILCDRHVVSRSGRRWGSEFGRAVCSQAVWRNLIASRLADLP